MCISSLLYLPSDDSIFLSNIVNDYHGQLALEIGTSSGTIFRELSKNFSIVIGTDIDFNSLKHSLMMSKNDRLICCDAATALHNVKFDLIVSNPPYLPNTMNHTDHFTETDGSSTSPPSTSLVAAPSTSPQAGPP